MSDTPDSSASPYAAFSTASGFDMLEKMWRMMQVPGLGGKLSPSSMMSDMMAPMTNIDELDKRITDMRAVEQWLKLNLNLLQSAIQALEVQRATLATLKAFGAFAQSSMEQASAGAPEVSKAFVPPVAPMPAAAPSGTPGSTSGPAANAAEAAATAPDPLASIDPTPWWNLLQTQFNQIAGLALAAQAAPSAAGSAAQKTAAQKTAKTAAGKPASKPAGAAKPVAKPSTPAKRAAPAKSRSTPKKP